MRRVCIHKGLFSSIIFMTLLIVGIVFVEFYFPMEGFREIVHSVNVTKCEDSVSLCFGLRAIRSTGLFGFFG